MGNKLLTLKDDYLLIHISIDQPFYYPGNHVYGKVYIRAFKAIPADFLEIEVEGVERVSFLTFKSREEEDENGHNRTVWDESIEHNVEKQIISFKSKCHTFTEEMQANDFVFNFDFPLPQNVPATILY